MTSTLHRVGLGAALLAATACARSATPVGGTGDAASRVYVAPGTYDEFYMFASGGFSGQVSVYGLPSGRLFRVIPVFSVDPEKSYGYSEQSKPMLNTSYGFVPWDDAHHPSLSKTDAMNDGRWLFINGNNTPRVARIDLAEMNTKEIIEIPNAAGNHASPFVTQGTEYVVTATRFSVPMPQKDVPIASYKENFGGQIGFVAVDPKSGKMSLAFQIHMPGFDYDLARPGKGPSHGWAFFTNYNTEQANTLLERNASQFDKDYITAVNWKQAEQCVAAGKAKDWPTKYAHNWVDEADIAHSEMLTSEKVLEPTDCPGMIYFLPTPKSPHGVDVDPTGEFIAGGGKLATVIPVHSFAKMLKAIEEKSFEKEIAGIPVLKYESVLSCEVPQPGLGPLHTEFDDKGNAYTSMFVSSEIVKWRVKDCAVLDRIPTYYAIGHLMVPGGDTRKPDGKYVIALNKITKDRYLPTGPELPQSAQLIDITGDKMKLLLDFPTIGEPHYAQAIKASLIKEKQIKTFLLTDNKDPFGVKSEKEARVEKKGHAVHIYLTAIRSHFAPDNIEGVEVGDSVYWHVTNLEQDWDVPHGFAVTGANTSELLVMPGQTRTIVWVPERAGVFPFYCTDFCSALHQEMQGYIRVSPKGAGTQLTFNASK
ncbi:MAG TPA: Sec-dependent nitrous-oxide reductase [Gemmatimonadales bacterium]|nr:Sec-dependent nitrous-oxide reductase [Gemmatimonadales bacterium]